MSKAVKRVGKRKPSRQASQTDPVQVTPEEKHRLAECCAFFKAEQFRAAAPDGLRKKDIEDAESKIEEAVRKASRS